MSDYIYDLDIQMQRVATFSTCPDLGQRRPINLAKTGLHYDPVSNKVRCHVCHEGIDLPPDSHPELRDTDVHGYISPNCPFVVGTYSNNVPVAEYSQEESLWITERLRQYQLQVQERDGTSSMTLQNSTPWTPIDANLQVTDQLLPSPTSTPWTPTDADGHCSRLQDNLQVTNQLLPSPTSTPWTPTDADGHCSRLQDNLQVTDQLLPSPTSTPTETYQDVLEPQLNPIDSGFRLEGRHVLVVS
ncbi:uncharacterized protein LOC121372548 [Gigantopelta aegis]|uniref:uncharacterized protein LOC121372548 n=1 Tax=Gigantopelta aegis TaxID=1735272 RepID=UPI001B88B89E|nr:uncharacterized protein LOC121372548 [Gigantopelta aegis]